METWFDQALKEMKDKGENNDEAVINLFEHIVDDLDSVVVLDPKEQFKPFVTESCING